MAMAAAFKPQTVAPSSFGTPAPVGTRRAPAGTFAPGTKVQVGGHRVVIERYLSEGGYAHVYVVRLPKLVDGSDLAVLKRVAVPDKEHLANMRTEVETMKRLKGHRHIVRYMDSHASQLKGGGYEVFLLMEYCSGGGLIDFMNTRLQNRLTEPEILNIFSDVAEGVACMHYLRPPLLHRDLKVENVLVSDSGSSRTYKLCDFGSAAAPREAASSATEGQSIKDNIRQHTTLQYRSPEMIDVYRKQPINEKSDIWALGVFLYKLCYYTTPFENVGEMAIPNAHATPFENVCQMAILNASFKFPAYPPFSDPLKMLIAKMLKENPVERPNIYQVLQDACSMRGKEIPIHDIYATSGSQSERLRSQQMHPTPQATSAATGAMLSPPPQNKAAAIPDIAPMRRGRPTKAVSHHGSAQPSPSPLRMIEQIDPFASLDGTKLAAKDELSSRFPTLDQFSLLTEKGRKHDFETSTHSKVAPEKADLSPRILDAFADETVALPSSPEKSKPAKNASLVINPSSRVVLDRRKSYEVKDMPQQQDDLVSSVPQRPLMVSTGTMTSPSPPPASDDRTIHQHPSANRSRRPSSLPRSPEASRPRSAIGSSGSRLADLLNQDAARSQPAALAVPKSPSSSRPSLEGGRPSMMEFEGGVSRSKSTNSKMRPVSGGVVSRMEFYRGRSSSKTYLGGDESPKNEHLSPPAAVESDTTITSDVEFLRAKEEEKVGKGYKRGSGHRKRASLTSMSLSGTKNLLTGRFGEAFRKFEGGGNAFGRRSRSPSPSQEHLNVMTPIAGSEATDLSDERAGLDGMEGLSPETRRELERRRLSAEEKRVANAGAEYKRRLAEDGQEQGRESRDATRAVSIQNKVQSLLQENERPTTKTAAGYGRYTNSDATSQMKPVEAPSTPSTKQPPGMPATKRFATRAAILSVEPLVSEPASAVNPLLKAPLHGPSPRPITRPAASPKPTNMRVGGNETMLQPVDTDFANGNIAISPSDEWEANFSKRYPSLSGLEMVETEIDGPKVATVRTKEI